MPPTDPADRPSPGTVVAIGSDERAELLWVDQAAFVFPDDPGHTLDYFEWDRTSGVRTDDGELVGVNTVFSLSVSLPTGELGTGTTVVPMAGLSWVSVHPGHRRRGVLRAMITAHLHDLHERGAEPVSGLHASETAIYGRFGYGLATVGYQVTLGRGATLRDLPGSDDVALRFVSADPDTHWQLVADVHTRACARRPGMVDRGEALTRDLLRMTPRQLERDEPLRLLVAERDGTPTGYAVLRRSVEWKDGSPDGTVLVFEIAAVDRESEHRLWRAVTDFDLTSTTKSWRVKPDDALLAWLVDPRSIKPVRTDELWLRVVDVDRALTARGYGHPMDLVLDVADELCPWNAGTWRLTGGPDGATCTRTDDAPDLALDVRELGSVLAGGVTLVALAEAGLVHERTPGVLARTSAAFRSAVEPATTFGF
ncbi:GNAT family N-acetyltransferase [Angustibacter peucedani]